MAKKKISIIGGYGGMGAFFARLFKDEGFSVTISGPSEVKGEKVAKELGAEYVKGNKKAAKDADIVMISVPIDYTLDVIKEVAPAVKKGALLMDVTSVKEEPCKAMKKFSGNGVEILGTHPVFSHRVGTLEGQVFVLTPVRGKKWLVWLKEFLSKHKARIYESTPVEHDRIMAVVQGLTHFAYISIGKTLQELDLDVKESRKFSSPIYELMLDIVGRIIGQNPELYASIQTQNPRVLEVHDAFLKTAKELNQTVKDKDEKKFMTIMSQAAKHFGDVDSAMGRSDKAIYSLISELDCLKNSIGKEICLKHIYSGKIHYGTVKEVTPDDVILVDSGKSRRLKISNLQILPDDELIESMTGKFGTVKRDFSFVFDDNINGRFIAKLLRGYDLDIIGVEIKDVYTGSQIGPGRKSICFGVEILNRNPKETSVRINEFFSRLGGAAR